MHKLTFTTLTVIAAIILLLSGGIFFYLKSNALDCCPYIMLGFGICTAIAALLFIFCLIMCIIERKDRIHYD